MKRPRSSLLPSRPGGGGGRDCITAPRNNDRARARARGGFRAGEIAIAGEDRWAKRSISFLRQRRVQVSRSSDRKWEERKKERDKSALVRRRDKKCAATRNDVVLPRRLPSRIQIVRLEEGAGARE